MAVISITGETSCRGDVDEEDASSQLVGHQSSVAAREAVAEELSAGVGPTEDMASDRPISASFDIRSDIRADIVRN